MSKDHSAADSEQMLLRAAQEVLLPLAALCVGRGLPYAKAEALFMSAYVQAARDARQKAGASAHRDISQVATATGLNRRDVLRVSEQTVPRAVQRMSPATQLFGQWVSDPIYRHANGHLRRLPRQGPAPSFETLAASITRHVHPRSLLEELLRLGLVRVDEKTDHVVLCRDRAVPEADEERLFELLSANVGDHLTAATQNVLSREPLFLEQAVFTDQLSDDTIEAARELARKKWRELLRDMVPELLALVQADRAAGRAPKHRIRVGMYAYNRALAAPGAAAADSTVQGPSAPEPVPGHTRDRDHENQA